MTVRFHPTLGHLGIDTRLIVHGVAFAAHAKTLRAKRRFALEAAERALFRAADLADLVSDIDRRLTLGER